MRDPIEMGILPRQGYGPEQVERTITLGDLLEAVEEAMETHGPDVQVLIRDPYDRYGAAWGGIAKDPFHDDEYDDE